MHSDFLSPFIFTSLVAGAGSKEQDKPVDRWAVLCSPLKREKDLFIVQNRGSVLRSWSRLRTRDAETSSDELLRIQNQQTLSCPSRLLTCLSLSHPELVSGSGSKNEQPGRAASKNRSSRRAGPCSWKDQEQLLELKNDTSSCESAPLNVTPYLSFWRLSGFLHVTILNVIK